MEELIRREDEYYNAVHFVQLLNEGIAGHCLGAGACHVHSVDNLASVLLEADGIIVRVRLNDIIEGILATYCCLYIVLKFVRLFGGNAAHPVVA